MQFKTILENFLTSNFNFNESEKLQKNRFTLLNSIFISGMLIAFFAGCYRLIVGPAILGTVDFIFSFSFFGLLLFLRQKKENYNTASTIALVISFFIFIAITLLLDNNQSKMVWFSLFIISSFLIKGYKFGLFATASTIITTHILHFLPSVDMHLENKELAMSTAAYICVAIFSAYAAKENEKSIKDLKESNQKVQKHQQQLYLQLRSNPFTKLPNLYALEEYLGTSKNDISLMILDIDAFDTITSEFGKPFSDQIIKQVHQTLESFTSNKTVLFHLFTDRFAFVIQNIDHDQDIKLAKSIKALFENIHLNHKEIDISITLSMGIARENSDKIILQANSALTEVKLQGKNGYKLFDNGIEYEEKQKNNIYWAKRIKEIIMEDNLVVYYQPIVNNKTQKTEKYECLVRAIDDDKIIPPYFFLDVAQTRGYLKNITKIIIDKSFRAFENSKFDFSINLTQDDLKDEDIVNFLRYKVDQYNIDPSRVYLEILENVTSLHSKESEKIFKEFKEIGFKISIDDFGAESSNFSRVLTIDADVIKIDGSFIKNLDTDENSLKIVETIVLFAKKIGAVTIAEFVHNEEIFNIVKELGVDYSQGYYFSPPLPQIDEVLQNVTTVN
jgi:diguanylate cyclase (GGDEF)-like protein